MAERGARIVAVADHLGGVARTEGLDVAPPDFQSLNIRDDDVVRTLQRLADLSPVFVDIALRSHTGRIPRSRAGRTALLQEEGVLHV